MVNSASELQPLWQRALADLSGAVGAGVARTWLQQVEPVGYSDSTVVLAAPHALAREQLEVRFGTPLRQALSSAAGEPVTVLLTVSPEQHDGGNPDGEGPDDEPLGQVVLGTPGTRSGAPPGTDDSTLNTRYTFDRFVIGDGNRFAHAAAFAVAEAPAKAYNPLFIYGQAGLGKTHLLQAVGHYARDLFGGLRVRYVTSEQFTNEFIESIQRGGADGFRGAFQRRYRDVDLLLIDDIQFLENKERTQEEFFHTFNHLHNNSKQVVISSDRKPRDMSTLEDRLRTRFEWGLMTDIQPPDLETRLAILHKKCAQDGITVPDDVLALIAERISSNIRELEGAFIRVAAFASLQHTEVSLGLAQMVLKDLFPDEGSSELSVSLIMSETANYFGYSMDELCSASRTRGLVSARQIAMYLTRELTDLSLPRIGQAFGGRDHTTVIHANRKIAELINTRPGIYEQVQELTSRCKTSARTTR